MGLVMACHYLNVPLHALRLSPGHFLDLPDAAFPDGTLRTIRIPIDPHGRMRINWAGRFSDDRLFRHYRFDGVVDPDADKDFREEFRNRLVLVGLTAAGTHDNAPNPFESLSPLVGTHANVINTILTQQFIHPDVGLSRVRNAAAILTMAVLVALAMAVLPRLWGSMVSLALAGLYLLTVELAFIYGGLSLPILNTVLAMAGAAGTVLLYRYLTEERLRKRIRSMFSTMVSPEVMKYMEEHPELFRLAGERKSATIFFSDVAGFTTISETLSPEDLARVLNEYLTPMSRILMAYQGYIDKYAGDGIMADFGVPVWDDPDKTSHAWKCCWAALDQQAELRHVREAFQRKYGIDIHVRMGINSGEVSAGTMGSEQKLQYTVMGDTVNQAARFEPANKDFHTRIIIGEPTFRLARAKIEVRFLALLMVKGKTEPVRAYELLAREGELTPEQRRLIDLFDAAWRLHAERRFEEAARQFEACLSIDPADGPSAVYLEVCRTYQKSPPPEEWRGEWIQTSK
jgi:adenylate cyclase